MVDRVPKSLAGIMDALKDGEMEVAKQATPTQKGIGAGSEEPDNISVMQSAAPQNPELGEQALVENVGPAEALLHQISSETEEQDLDARIAQLQAHLESANQLHAGLQNELELPQDEFQGKLIETEIQKTISIENMLSNEIAQLQNQKNRNEGSDRKRDDDDEEEEEKEEEKEENTNEEEQSQEAEAEPDDEPEAEAEIEPEMEPEIEPEAEPEFEAEIDTDAASELGDVFGDGIEEVFSNADSAVDTTADAAVDTAADAAVDAAADAAVDAAADAAVDAAADAAVDAAVDATADAVVDTAVDVAVDTAVDLGTDAASTLAEEGGQAVVEVAADSVIPGLPSSDTIRVTGSLASNSIALATAENRGDNDEKRLEQLENQIGYAQTLIEKMDEHRAQVSDPTEATQLEEASSSLSYKLKDLQNEADPLRVAIKTRELDKIDGEFNIEGATEKINEVAHQTSVETKNLSRQGLLKSAINAPDALGNVVGSVTRTNDESAPVRIEDQLSHNIDSKSSSTRQPTTQDFLNTTKEFIKITNEPHLETSVEQKQNAKKRLASDYKKAGFTYSIQAGKWGADIVSCIPGAVQTASGAWTGGSAAVGVAGSETVVVGVAGGASAGGGATAFAASTAVNVAPIVAKASGTVANKVLNEVSDAIDSRVASDIVDIQADTVDATKKGIKDFLSMGQAIASNDQELMQKVQERAMRNASLTAIKYGTHASVLAGDISVPQGWISTGDAPRALNMHTEVIKSAGAAAEEMVLDASQESQGKDPSAFLTELAKGATSGDNKIAKAAIDTVTDPTMFTPEDRQDANGSFLPSHLLQAAGASNKIEASREFQKAFSNNTGEERENLKGVGKVADLASHLIAGGISGEAPDMPKSNGITSKAKELMSQFQEITQQPSEPNDPADNVLDNKAVTFTPGAQIAEEARLKAKDDAILEQSGLTEDTKQTIRKT